MSGLDWLDKGPDEWNKRYTAAQSPAAGAIFSAVMWALGPKECPLCKGPHNLSKCPRWIGVPK
jgi:hypothetical protein